MQINLMTQYSIISCHHHSSSSFIINILQQSLVSYDLRANPEYTEAYALDSKCIREYLKGHMTVTGEDFRIAFKQRGLLRNCIGQWLLKETPASEGVAIFSDITHELCDRGQRYTTQVRSRLHLHSHCYTYIYIARDA
jgi:hypothetical protein